MTTLTMIAVDLLAIGILTGMYFRRHHRRDLVAAFLGVNAGVLAVSIVLAETEVGLGIGLGLFGVLSIIRLRSSEITQREVAYYFAALALGLIAGLTTTVGPVPLGLLVLLVAVLYVADHPRLLTAHRHQTLLLDTAHTDEAALVAELERRTGGRVTGVTVQHVDLVNDTTLVDARFTVPARTSARSSVRRGAGPARSGDRDLLLHDGAPAGTGVEAGAGVGAGR
jgi:hypothetical protein